MVMWTSAALVYYSQVVPVKRLAGAGSVWLECKIAQTVATLAQLDADGHAQPSSMATMVCDILKLSAAAN